MNELFLIIAAAIAVILVVVVLVQGWQLHRTQATLAASQKNVAPKVTPPTAADLEAKLKAAYEGKIVAATATFGTDLEATSKRLSEQVSRLTTTVIEEELEAYQKTLEQVRASAVQAMDQIHQAVEHQRVELRQGMEADLAKEKQALADKFDAKLGDVVASYISESLGSGVDIGAQMQFILTSLEAHKDDIRKDLLGDA
jgi:hypothetical protein